MATAVLALGIMAPIGGCLTVRYPTEVPGLEPLPPARCAEERDNRELRRQVNREAKRQAELRDDIAKLQAKLQSR